jgi:methyl-accepting chemotaxis protein
MLKKMKIRTKLIASFLLIAIINVAIVYEAVLSLKRMTASNKAAYENTTVPIGYCVDIASLFQQMRVDVTACIVLDKKDEIESTIDQFYLHSAQLDSALQKYSTTFMDNTDKQNWQIVKKGNNESIKLMNDFAPLVLKNDDKAATAFMINSMMPLKNKLQPAIANMVKYNVTTGEKMANDGYSMALQSISLIIGLLIGGIIFTLLFSYLIIININKMTKTISSEVSQTIEAAISGKLNVRADAKKVNFEFRFLVEGLNRTLDAVMAPLKVAADYIDQISKGKIPQKITDTYIGDYNEIKENLNACIDNLNGLIIEMDVTSNLQKAGDIEAFANEDKFEGSYKSIIKGYNDVMKMHIAAILYMLDLLKEYAAGDLSREMMKMPGKQIIATERINQLRQNILNLITDADLLAKASVEGKLSTRVDASKHKGDFRKIIEGVNQTLDSVIGPLNVAAEYVDQISKGIVPEKITEKYNGDFNVIKNNINQCINGLGGLVAANKVLEKMAVNDYTLKMEGNYLGIFSEVAQSLNLVYMRVTHIVSVTDSFSKGDLDELPALEKMGKRSENDIVQPAFVLLGNTFKQITEKAKLIAQGDLTVSLEKRSEKDELMEALDNMVKSIASTVSEFKIAIENIVSASQALQSVAVQLSEGSTEQAASTEEVSSSMEEMVSNINQNSDNSTQTEKIALQASKDIEEGNKAVTITVDAMKKIADKISVIGEIAEKTDLLAINAAIEAARAGEQGKGFAVVAAEVRKLAENSQAAAKEIDELSKSSVRIADESGKLLQKIVPDIQKTATLVQEITASSLEQNTGATQINSSIMQLNAVTQRNSAASEELSSSAEELASQAEQLSETISFFKTENDNAQVRKQNRVQQTQKVSLNPNLSKSNHLKSSSQQIKHTSAKLENFNPVNFNGKNKNDGVTLTGMADDEYEKF